MSIYKKFDVKCKKCGNKHPDIVIRNIKFPLDQVCIENISLKVEYDVYLKCNRCKNEAPVNL